jgi:hypothetical protein
MLGVSACILVLFTCFLALELVHHAVLLCSCSMTRIATYISDSSSRSCFCCRQPAGRSELGCTVHAIDPCLDVLV